MRARTASSFLLIASAVVVGCTTSKILDDDDGVTIPLGAGGTTSAPHGGTSAGAQAGMTTGGTLGAGASSGATSVQGSGGSSVNNGGAPNGTGGSLGAGGAKAIGGAGSGGSLAIGGMPNNAGGAGASNLGGMPNHFGGMGGVSGSRAGGAGGTGGASSGGAPAMGGAGAGTAGDASTEMCAPGMHSSAGTKHCGTSDSGTDDGSYTYNIYSDGKGSGCMTTYGVNATFSATWSNVGDWIAREGLSFDKTKTYDKIGVFSSDFAYTTSGITTGGFGNIGIYGWSVNPLHEYYIIEDWLGKRPAFTSMGQFTIDGEGTYDIQTNTQTNQPNITGTNATFIQFWSVRTTPRSCGHISISKHFDEWAQLGMQLGNLEEARILVEAQDNTGSIDFTTATVVAK